MKQPFLHIATFLLAALLLAACSSDSLTASDDDGQIVFGAEVQSASTRGGSPGSINYQTLAGAGYGFGVFASSSNSEYTGWFANKQVTYTGPTPVTEPTIIHVHPNSWTYDGGSMKDWPKSEAISFFAYAPFTTNFAGTGITGITDSGTDHPTVGYAVASDPSQSVDLLWGVRAGANSNGDRGMPWLNATLSETGGPVIFTFHHALAAIGFKVQAIVDKDNNLSDLNDQSATGRLGTDCKVTLKSIRLTPATTPFKATGTLDLNNVESSMPNWTSTSGTIASLTVEGGQIATNLKDDNPSAGSLPAVTGVTESANSQKIIAGDNLFMVIPEAGQDYTVDVEYYITYSVPGGGVRRLEYVVGEGKLGAGTATISSLALNPDTKYYLNLVIGLKTFRLTVEATDWADVPLPLDVEVEQGTSASSSLSRANLR